VNERKGRCPAGRPCLTAPSGIASVLADIPAELNGGL